MIHLKKKKITSIKNTHNKKEKKKKKKKKKKKERKAKDYRPIAMTHISYKLFMNVVKEEIEHPLNENDQMQETRSG